MRPRRKALNPLSLLVLALGLPQGISAATLTVTTTADSGPGSLRQAILDSNASAGTLDTIEFVIPGASETHQRAGARKLAVTTRNRRESRLTK